MTWWKQRHILRGRKIVPVDDDTYWQWRRTDGFIVAQEDIGDYWVSTVFLGRDDRFGEDLPPRFFETEVFRRNADGTADLSCSDFREGASTYDEAEAIHAKACDLARRGLPDE